MYSSGSGVKLLKFGTHFKIM